MEKNEKIERVYDPENQKPMEYYDSKAAKDIDERTSTKTFNHRVFNNWVKSVLIHKYTTAIKEKYKEDWGEDDSSGTEEQQPQRRGTYPNQEKSLQLSVLDIACGKGGDFKKWQFAGTRNYFGVDISYKAIQDASARKITSFKTSCTTFIQQDAAAKPDDFFANFPQDMYFDIASCQFSMHYMFSSKEKTKNFLQNVSSRLLNDGYFICTFPDSNVIVKKLREDGFTDPQTGYTVSENSFYSLISKTTTFPKAKGPYGLSYGFFLSDNLVGLQTQEGTTKKIHYVPEYLVLVKDFIELAKEYNLEVEESKNFHEFYSENIKNNHFYDLFKNRMRFEVKKEDLFLMSADLWDVSYLYRILAFKKVGGDKEMNELDRSAFKPTKYFKVYPLK